MHFIPQSAGVDGTAINPSSIGVTTPVGDVNMAQGSKIRMTDAGVTSLLRLDTGVFMFRNGADNQYANIFAFGAYVNEIIVTGVNYGYGVILQNSRISSRGVPNTVAIEYGATAQKFEVYATNGGVDTFERVSVSFNSGSSAFIIGTEKGASGGSARDLGFAIDGATKLTITAAGYIIPVLPTSAAGLPTGALWNDSGTVKVA